jgi:membrane protein
MKSGGGAIADGASRSLKQLQRLVEAWASDRCSRKAAALAYYSVFSLAPLLVIVVAVASWFVPDEVITEGLTDQAKLLLGEGGAALVAQLLRNARAEQSAGLAALLATGVLLLGATSAFGELKASLDDIWGVGPRANGPFFAAVRSRLLSFGLVLSLAFLLLVSLLVSSALEVFSGYFGARLGIGGTVVLQGVSFASSLLVITLLFAVIYKLLPDVRLAWKEVALSSVLTALLFMAGHALLGKYLNDSAAVSVYGKASSLAVLLVWVYYSTMIFFLGAEITKVWRRPVLMRKGRAAQPRFHSASITAQS